MNPNGIIFYSVGQFVEQVGRRQIWRYGELDQMVCVWIGPLNQAANFRPRVNSSHPEFPLMFCTDSSITYKEALVAEVEVTYQGIIQTTGARIYRTPPIISTTPVQGSRDFEVEYLQQMSPAQWAPLATQIATPQGPYQFGPIYVYGTQKVNVRYIGDQVVVRYQAYPEPDPNNPYYSSKGLPLVGWSILSEVLGEITVTGVWNGPGFNPAIAIPRIAPTAPPLRAAYLGMSTTQKGKWFDVQENYGPTF